MRCAHRGKIPFGIETGVPLSCLWSPWTRTSQGLLQLCANMEHESLAGHAMSPGPLPYGACPRPTLCGAREATGWLPPASCTALGQHPCQDAGAEGAQMGVNVVLGT